MFFREKKTSSKPTLQLVESYRTAKGKVRQRVVVSLADCCVPDELRRLVAVEVTHRMAGYRRLLDEDPLVELWVGRVLERIEAAGKLPEASRRQVRIDRKHFERVCVDDIEHEDGVELGPYLVLLAAWKSLELDQVLRRRKFSPGQLATAKASVLNRLMEPVLTTALGDLLDVRPEGWAEDRFYRVSDRLLSGRSELETHLRERERSLFNLQRTIVLYDLTNSYFEGSAASNPLARRSVNSKEKRSDCPLISVGLVLDAEGFVLTHRVFRGNVSDCRTLLEGIAALENADTGSSKPTIVVDGGMATKDNLAELRNRGYDYIVNGKRQKRAQFAEDFLDRDSFRRVDGRGKRGVDQPVFVRRIRSGDEMIVLCRSDGRRDKENAIQDGAERKLIEGLEKLEARILREDPRLKLHESAALVNRAVGRLVSRTTRASKLYRIEYDHEKRSLVWDRREQDWEKSRELHGCYHLRSTRELEDRQLWRIYITLTRVEDAFRSMKSELGLRPFHHQLEKRCKAHIWITVMALHLQRWVEHSLKLSGYECTWKNLRRRLQTHCYATLITPTEDGLEHHDRKPGRPNEVQRLIYSMMGIDWKDLPVTRRTYKTGQCAKT
jgi:transposase